MGNDSAQIIFEPKIYELDEKKVILDSDLAKSLNMETRYLNRVVKRHIEIFNEEEYYKLTQEEYSSLRSQNVTSKSDFVTSKNRGGRVYYLPYVFTGEGAKKVMTLFNKSKVIDACNNIVKMLDHSLIADQNHGETLEKLIYEVRGKQVMLDYDLARLYECQNGTKTVNLAVKRNIERFPEEFCFQLTKDEYANLKFQFETSSWNDYGGIRKLPHAFTEEGVAMLASVLHTSVAAKISVEIMKAFVSMKRYISGSLIEQKHINNLVLEDHSKIKVIEDYFKAFKRNKKTEIYYNGQIYDAYSKILDIFNKASDSLIIIDNYADKNLLDIIRNLNVKVIIITMKGSLLSELDIKKYHSQYDNLCVFYDNSFHDRFFIIDKSVVYHCGTSINRIGYKTFAINKIDEQEIIESLISKVEKIIS